MLIIQHCANITNKVAVSDFRVLSQKPKIASLTIFLYPRVSNESNDYIMTIGAEES